METLYFVGGLVLGTMYSWFSTRRIIKELKILIDHHQQRNDDLVNQYNQLAFVQKAEPVFPTEPEEMPTSVPMTDEVEAAIAKARLQRDMASGA
jgi:hypothetical protein